jgi:hypothetical protein
MELAQPYSVKTTRLCFHVRLSWMVPVRRAAMFAITSITQPRLPHHLSLSLCTVYQSDKRRGRYWLHISTLSQS